MGTRRLTTALAIASIASLVLTATVAGDGDGRRGTGAVYTLSNSATGNAVVAFARRADGSLSAPVSYPTGGLGSGGGLGSQGAVVLSDEGRWLLAVDAGSDEISAFAVRDDHRLRLADRTGSGGDMPISVTIHGRLVYALNAGGAGNISGFWLGRNGDLMPIPNSSRPLSSSASGPAQVEFTPDGKQLVVTEKDTNVISTYRVDRHGLATGPTVNTSAGATPFGFAFGDDGHLIVSEAFGGAPGASAVSSYRVRGNGTLRTISPSVATTQTAACWVVVTGQFAYETNTGSGTVSSYRIAENGAITLLQAVAGDTGTGSSPIDATVTGGRYLYVLGAGSHEITIFRVRSNGTLLEMGAIGGLPASSVGLAGA
jgi:6-phosphogluconolactonase